MYKKNKQTRENARSAKDIGSKSSEIINSAEKNDDDSNSGVTADVRENTPKEELKKKNIEKLKSQGVENPTEEDVKTYMDNKVNVEYKNLGKTGGLFDYSFEYGSCIVTFNMDHIFYRTTLEDLFKSNDVKIAFELYVASLVRAVDETNKVQEDQNDNLIARWNEKLRRYINEQQNFAKK